MSASRLVPAGPARLRASDTDRERLAAVLRTHYEAGRLSDDDLERRLASAFTARTVGELRALVSDLPGPPPTFGQRLARGLSHGARGLGWWFRRPLRAVVTGVGALVLLGAIVGPQHPKRTAGTTPAIPAAQPPGTAYDPPPDHITRVGRGGTGVDHEMSFRVVRVRHASELPLRYEGGPIDAGPGRVYAVVEVEARNRASVSQDPFCGENGSRLFSRGGRGFDPDASEYKVRGNDTMCHEGGLTPGESAVLRLVFRVPRGTREGWIDLWNQAEPSDILGHTRIRAQLPG